MPKLVLVEWRDSRQPLPGWQRLEDLDFLESCDCVSVGFLIRKTKTEIVLAPNVADLDDNELIQGSGVIVIPRNCVTRVTDLQWPVTPGRSSVTVS